MDSLSSCTAGSSLPAAAPHPAHLSDINAFKNQLAKALRLEDSTQLPFEKIEHAYEVLNGNEDFMFNEPEERLSNFLIVMACLTSVMQEKKVCFISPTHHYGLQAANKRNRFLSLMQAPEERKFSVVIPGMSGAKEVINASEVLFMHGKDFTQYLPQGWTGRKIIQIFPGEDVPVDPYPRNPYCCGCD